MKMRWHGVVVLVLGAVLLGIGALGASAKTDQGTSAAHPASLVESARDGAANLARLIGISDDDDDVSVAPGTLEEGQELLPQAKLTVEQAIETAQGAVSGSVGEVELEHSHGRLVFNVDVGGKEVAVDATTGEVLGAFDDDD